MIYNVFLTTWNGRKKFHPKIAYCNVRTSLQKCPALCGLRGWKNRPAPLPGWMWRKATKPGSDCLLLSQFSECSLLFISVTFCVPLVCVCMCICMFLCSLLVVLVKLSVPAKWLSRWYGILESHSTQYRSFRRRGPWAVMYISHSVMEGQRHNNPFNPRCFWLSIKTPLRKPIPCK